MIDSVIIEYLANNRRLVIPKLGAFLVKESDRSIVFSELLRGDDGVLRGLIKARGVGDIEAAGVIDRFVFEVRHALDRGREYPIGEFGTLHRGENGIISFRSSSVRRHVPPAGVAEQAGARPVQAAAAGSDARPRGGSAERTPVRRKRKTDVFLIVAVAIALAAVAVMVYGYLRAREQEGTSLREMFLPSRPAVVAPAEETVALPPAQEVVSAQDGNEK